MNRAALNCLGIFAFFLPISLKADSIKLSGRPTFKNVQILEFRAERVQFRGVSGEILRKPLSEVEWLAAEAAPDLSAAEQLRVNGRFDSAMARYEQVSGEDGWTVAVALRRRIDCANRLQDPQSAVAALLQVLSIDPEFDASLTLVAIRPPKHELNSAALKQLRGANLRGHAGMIGLLLEITILEEPARARADFRAPAQTAAPTDGAPDDDRLFARARIKLGGQYLPQDGRLRNVLRESVEAGNAVEARVRYEAARPFVAPESAAAWHLLDARLRIDEGQAADAANRLVSLRGSSQDPEFQAETEYDLGLAHERLGLNLLAAELYRELAAREETPAAWKDRALAALQRVSPESKSTTTQPVTGP